MSVSFDVSKKYRSRDMRGSKVFRRAIDLFGESSIIRKRQFNAISDSRILKDEDLGPSSLANSVYAKPRVFPNKEKRKSSITDDVIETEVDEYHKWLEQRKEMRAQLEQVGNVKKWLSGKECTPSEKKLLESIKSRNKKSSVIPDDEGHVLKVTSDGENEEKSFTKDTNNKLMVPLIKHPTPQALGKIEEYIAKHRLRLVDMFTRMDKNKDWLISCSECQQMLKKLKVPVTDDEIDELVSALDKNNDGYLDYRELLKGRLAYKQGKKKHIDKKDGKLSPQMAIQSPQYLSIPDDNSYDSIRMCGTDSTDSDSEYVKQPKRERMKSKQQHFRENKRSPESTQSTRMKQHIAASTLQEPTSHWVDRYRNEELKQFQNLILHCRNHGIVLNQSLLERALLSPEDQDCARKLKQSTTTLSSHFADPLVEEEELTSSSGLIECFGGPYLQLRGPRKGQVIKLTTGVAHIKSKTDCWLTFDEYRKLTQHIKSRFPFKYHGIPDDSVFWPGHILHKMRLCMPPYSENKHEKTASVKNFFQPVHSVQASVLPMVSPRVVWPVNDAGYVQLGDNGRRKSYAL